MLHIAVTHALLISFAFLLMSVTPALLIARPDIQNDLDESTDFQPRP